MKHSLGMIAIALVVTACGGGGGETDAGHGGPGAACTEITEACHSVDTGTGPIAECHDLAHDGPAETCEERLAECVALCEAAHDQDGGGHAHDDDAGSHAHDEDAGTSGGGDAG